MNSFTQFFTFSFHKQNSQLKCLSKKSWNILVTIRRFRSAFGDGVPTTHQCHSPKKPQNEIEFPECITTVAKRLKQSLEFSLETESHVSVTDEMQVSSSQEERLQESTNTALNEQNPQEHTCEFIFSPQEVEMKDSINEIFRKEPEIQLHDDILACIFRKILFLAPVYCVCKVWKRVWDRVWGEEYFARYKEAVKDSERSTFKRHVGIIYLIEKSEIKQVSLEPKVLTARAGEVLIHREQIIVSDDSKQCIQVFNVKGEVIRKIDILKTFNGEPFTEITESSSPIYHLQAFEDIVLVEYRVNAGSSYIQAFQITTGNLSWEKKFSVAQSHLPLCLVSSSSNKAHENGKEVLILKECKFLDDKNNCESKLSIVNVVDGTEQEFTIKSNAQWEHIFFSETFIRLGFNLYPRTSQGVEDPVNLETIFETWFKKLGNNDCQDVLVTEFKVFQNFVVVLRKTRNKDSFTISSAYYYGLISELFSEKPFIFLTGFEKANGESVQLFEKENTLTLALIKLDSTILTFLHINGDKDHQVGNVIFHGTFHSLYFLTPLIIVCRFQINEEQESIIFWDLKANKAIISVGFENNENNGKDYFSGNTVISVAKFVSDKEPMKLLASYQWDYDP